MADRTWIGKTGLEPEAPEGAAEEETRQPWRMTAENNPQMMLDIRWADGLEDSYPYFQLVGMRLDGAFLRLFFQRNTVLVKGRHVRELRNKLRKNCVEYMQERHQQAHLVPESEPYIEEITIAPPDLEALGRRPL